MPYPGHLRVIDGGAARLPTAETPAQAPTLEAAFRAHAGFVASVALRVLGRSSEVDDLVQEVFLRVHGSLRDLRDPEALRGWLAIITARLARRRLRGRRVKLWLGIDADYDYAGLAAPGASPEEQAMASELYRALDRLPSGQRLAWTLRHVEGLALDDVAAACQCSLATVKRWIAAAHATLRGGRDHG